MTNTVYIVLYSYRNKDTLSIIDQMLSTAKNNITIKFIDQHPLDRESRAIEIAKQYEGAFVDYEHIFWDSIYSPIYQKNKAIESMPESFEYLGIISDDVEFAPGWDATLIDFVNNNDHAIVSGKGKISLTTGKYMLEASYSSSSDFSVAQYISRNLIFGKEPDIKQLEWPVHLKYFGEQELMTLDAIGKGLNIFSAPSSLYIDRNIRSIENIYCPFSKQHHYNSVVDTLQAVEGLAPGLAEMISFHNLDRYAIKKLPYQIDDVLYDPHKLEFNSFAGERFIGKTKAIY